MLSLAQWDVNLEVHSVLECANVNHDSLPTDKMAALLSDIRYIRDLGARFRSLSVDKTEYACLKAIVLFRPGGCLILLASPPCHPTVPKSFLGFFMLFSISALKHP